MVDAETDAPLGGLAFVVFREKPNGLVLVEGVTDERGRAELGRLPADVLLVETARRSPHCSTLTGVRLEEGAEADVELRVLRGGFVTVLTNRITVRCRIREMIHAPIPISRMRIGRSSTHSAATAANSLSVHCRIFSQV